MILWVLTSWRSKTEHFNKTKSQDENKWINPNTVETYNANWTFEAFVSPVSDNILFLIYRRVMWASRLHTEGIREWIFPERQRMNIHFIQSSCVQGLRGPFLILFSSGAYRALSLLPYLWLWLANSHVPLSTITVPFSAVITSMLKVEALCSSKTLVLQISHWYQPTR